MSRYIDAIQLIEKWEKECGRGTNDGICQGDCFDCQFPAAIDDLKDAPTVDAVPVVRCRECVQGLDSKRCGGAIFDDNVIWCTHIGEYFTKDHYCADGERKDGEHEQ